MKIGVGISGFGLSARVFHLPLLQVDHEFEVKAIHSSQHHAIKQYFPAVEAVDSFESLVKRQDVQLILVCVPNHLHYSYCKIALEAGKHVVVEKPFVVESAKGQSLLELARERQLLLEVFHNRRWDGDFLTIKKLINSDLLGNVMYYEAHFDRFRMEVGSAWKEQSFPGGGVLFDLGSHLIDQTLQLFGKPQSLFADVAVQRAGAVNPDYFHIVLKFGALRVVLHSSCIVSGKTPRYQVQGTKGSYIKYGIDPQEGQLKAGISPENGKFGKDEPKDYGDLYQTEAPKLGIQKYPTEKGDYRLFYHQVAKKISNNDCSSNASEALQVIKIIEASLESSRSGREIFF